MQAANRLDDLFEVNASMRTWVLKVRKPRSLLRDLDTQILTPQMHRDGLSWLLHFSQKTFYLQKLRDHSSGPGRAARDGKVILRTFLIETRAVNLNKRVPPRLWIEIRPKEISLTPVRLSLDFVGLLSQHLHKLRKDAQRAFCARNSGRCHP